jgi:hypothetical protein
MNAKRFLRGRLGILLALFGIIAISFAGPQQRAAMATCPDQARFTCYSDATYTTVVGYCYHACCQLWTCVGEVTDYQKLDYKISCSTN